MAEWPPGFEPGASTDFATSAEGWAARESNPPGDKPHQVLSLVRLPTSPAARWWPRLESNQVAPVFSRVLYRLSFRAMEEGGGVEPRSQTAAARVATGARPLALHLPNLPVVAPLGVEPSSPIGGGFTAR